MRAPILLLLIGLLALPAKGQTIWSRPYEPNQFAVETVVPESPEEASLLSGATFVTGSFSLSNRIQFTAELPVARFGATAEGISSTTALGNPYLGFDLSSTRLPILVQVGTRLPAAPSNAAARLGQSTDVGRLPAFRHDEFGLSLLVNGRFALGDDSSLRVRVGPAYASRPRSGQRVRDWRALYEVQVWEEGERLITGLSVTGRATLTTPDNSQHHAALSVMGNWQRVQPGLLTGVALNDLFENGAFTPFVGLTLSVTYRRE